MKSCLINEQTVFIRDIMIITGRAVHLYGEIGIKKIKEAFQKQQHQVIYS